MAKRRNGEGTYGEKIINGKKYKFFRINGKYFYGKTEKECREKYKSFCKTNTSSDAKNLKKMLFCDYILEWLKIKGVELKENTKNGYEHCINGQLIKYKHHNLGRMQVGTIEQEDIQEYYTSLATHYARGTIKKNYAIISECIDDARKNKITDPFDININMKYIKLPSEDVVLKKEREIHFLTDEDIVLFCKEARRVNTSGYNFGGKIGELTYGNNANLLIFIIYTGLRVSEAIELKWSDFDLTEGKERVTVSKNTVRVKSENGGYKTKTTTTKTASGNRTIPLSKQALQVIEYEHSINPTHKKDDYVFITKNGSKNASRQNVNRTLKCIMARAGCSIDYCTPHELRHTFGSLLLRKGVDIKIVSKLLGHKDISVTYNVYIHILQEQEVDAIGKLDFLD